MPLKKGPILGADHSSREVAGRWHAGRTRPNTNKYGHQDPSRPVSGITTRSRSIGTGPRPEIARQISRKQQISESVRLAGKSLVKSARLVSGPPAAPSIHICQKHFVKQKPYIECLSHIFPIDPFNGAPTSTSAALHRYCACTPS